MFPNVDKLKEEAMKTIDTKLQPLIAKLDSIENKLDLLLSKLPQ